MDRDNLYDAISGGAWVNDPTGYAEVVGQLKYIKYVLEEFNPSEEE